MKSKESNSKSPDKAQEGIFDARTLGTPRMLVLGMQHMFAMFGATVLVPALRSQRIVYPLFCRRGNTSISSDFERDRSCISRVIVCFPGRILGHRSRRRSRSASVCVFRSGLCGGALSDSVRAVPGIWSRKSHAVLPACGYRPHHYCHRAQSFEVGGG